MRIARETWILGLLGVIDLIYTVWLLQQGSAIEVNPILNFYLAYGLPIFIAAKLLLVIGPLTGIEWVRIRRPVFVQKMLRIGIALYISFYTLGFLHINYI